MWCCGAFLPGTERKGKHNGTCGKNLIDRYSHEYFLQPLDAYPSGLAACAWGVQHQEPSGSRRAQPLAAYTTPAFGRLASGQPHRMVPCRLVGRVRTGSSRLGDPAPSHARGADPADVLFPLGVQRAQGLSGSRYCNLPAFRHAQCGARLRTDGTSGCSRVYQV